jgi:AraC-like DNA-binding protein
VEFAILDPPPQLAESVKSIWRARGTKAEFDSPEPIVPDGCVEIIFNLGDRFINADTGELQPRDLLAGQMTRPVVARPTGDVDLIGVRFKTGRAGAALRIPMWELQDQLIAASDVINGCERIVDHLREIDRDDRLDRLSIELGSRLASKDASSDVERALAMIDDSRGCIAIETIATRIGISRRHLERRFRDEVGLGVKHLARIARIHGALDLLRSQPQMSGAEVAAVCGYSDQAHLIRECQELAGRTPQRLKTTDRSLAGLMRS